MQTTCVVADNSMPVRPARDNAKHLKRFRRCSGILRVASSSPRSAQVWALLVGLLVTLLLCRAVSRPFPF